MSLHCNPYLVTPSTTGTAASDLTIPQLVGQVYETAPALERCRILEHLMEPLGALSLVAVANGVFAKIWFRSGWHDLHIQPSDAQAVQVGDVVSLADYVQQASVETVNGLASLLTTSPMIVYSAAAALLVTALLRRTHTHRTGAGESGDPPESTSLNGDAA